MLSVRAPPPEAKLKLLKEIAEEHEVDWDPAGSETELFKSPQDLLVSITHVMLCMKELKGPEIESTNEARLLVGIPVCPHFFTPNAVLLYLASVAWSDIIIQPVF